MVDETGQSIYSNDPEKAYQWKLAFLEDWKVENDISEETFGYALEDAEKDYQEDLSFKVKLKKIVDLYKQFRERKRPFLPKTYSTQMELVVPPKDKPIVFLQERIFRKIERVLEEGKFVLPDGILKTSKYDYVFGIANGEKELTIRDKERLTDPNTTDNFWVIPTERGSFERGSLPLYFRPENLDCFIADRNYIPSVLMHGAFRWSQKADVAFFSPHIKRKIDEIQLKNLERKVRVYANGDEGGIELVGDVSESLRKMLYEK